MKGTDIHAYVEYRKHLPPNASQASNPWISFTIKTDLGRNYAMFGILANVRTRMGNMFPPRGLPQNAGYEVMRNTYFYVSDLAASMGDPDAVSEEVAKEYVNQGAHIWTMEDKDEQWVSNPKHFAHTWLSTAEFAQCVDMYKRRHATFVEIKYEAVLAAMKQFDKRGYEARIVFWFEEKSE